VGGRGMEKGTVVLGAKARPRTSVRHKNSQIRPLERCVAISNSMSSVSFDFLIDR
jgi:hypothetical protein